ncbi:MAG: hypothetical protein E6I35_06835 [Chloroflexi bacterium]|nr:MAG: hypothetical protein E6I35_06835 [Chloroflexota bacterium]
MAKRNLAELKIPAASAFIPVAKRVATTLGGQLGLSLMDLDELAIALTQACDSAIAAADDLGTPADLKLTYFATNRALVVDVDLMPTGAALPLPRHETHMTGGHLIGIGLIDADSPRGAAGAPSPLQGKQ